MNDDETIARARTGAIHGITPLVALVEAGVDVPAGVTIDIKDDIVDAQHIVLSATPADDDNAGADDTGPDIGGSVMSRSYN